MLPSSVNTIIDSWFIKIAQYFQNITNIQISNLHSQILAVNVSFEDAYAAFQAFPSTLTLTAAMSACTRSKMALSKFPDEILALSSWLFDAIKQHFYLFTSDTMISTFVQQLAKDGLSIKYLKKQVSHVFRLVKDEECQVYSIACKLWVILDSIYLLDGEDIEIFDLSQLQQEISLFIDDMRSIFEQAKKDPTKITTKMIHEYSNSLSKVFKALHLYPLSQPLPILNHWKRDIETLLQSKFGTTVMTEAMSALEATLLQLKLAQKIVDIKEIICSSLNFENFCSLYDLVGRERCNQLLLCKLTLADRYASSTCLNTLSKWLYPDLIIQIERNILVILERLSPKYTVIFQTEQPYDANNIPCNNIILYPKDNQWGTCTISDNDLSYNVVKDELVANALDKNMRELLEINDTICLEKEKAAILLDAMGYEKEITTHFSLQFCGQSLINEYNLNMCILSIDLKTCLCEQHTFEDARTKDFNEKIIIVQCLHNSLELVQNLKFLELTKDHILQMQSSVAACILKYPCKSATLLSVDKCGFVKKAEFNFFLPLVSEIGENPFEKLNYLSDILNMYDQLYEATLPISLLNNALESTLKDCPTFIYGREVPNLVRSIRRHFVLKCVQVHTSSNDMQAIQQMKQVFKNIPADQSTVEEDIYFLGMESYLQFLLFMIRQREHRGNFSIANPLFVEAWKLVLENENSVSLHTAQCLCSAFAYLRDFDDIDNSLTVTNFQVRLRMCAKITEGLTLIVKNAPTLRKLCSTVMQLINNIEHVNKFNRIQIFQQVCEKEHLCFLLSMIGSIEELHDEFLDIECVKSCDLSKDFSCSYEMVHSLEFYSIISKITISWFYRQMHKMVELFQIIISNDCFAQDTHRDLLLNTFYSFLVSRLETGFKKFDLELIHSVLSIGIMLAKALQAKVVEKCLVLKEANSTDLLSNLLTIIQVLKISPDLRAAVSILQELPCEQWLSNLFTVNFIILCNNHFKTDCQFLYDQLTSIDPKLLQILYNVFVNDQYQQVAITHSSVGILTLSQLAFIVQLLPFVEECSDAYSLLCKTSMSLWEKELALIHFKQYVDHWTDFTTADKQRVHYLMNRVRLKAGIPHLEFMSLLYTIRSKFVRTGEKDCKLLLTLFEDLYYKRISLAEVRPIIIDHDYLDWLPAIKDIISQRSREPLEVDEIIYQIECQIKSGTFCITPDEFEQFKAEAKELVECIQHHSKQDLPTPEKLKAFFEILQRFVSVEEKEEWLKKNRVQFILHIVLAWMLFTSATLMQIPYNTQIVSVLLFLQTTKKGLLQQVKTGEGKTLIVGFLAAAKALLGYKVDVVSSNRDLAKDGRDKCHKFFRILGLKAAVNCEEDDDTNQQAYNSHIVYGEVGSFQRDVLTEENKPGGTQFSARYSESEKNCLLVDEVDSMFLDKGRHMLYLSHESPALKHLESLFIQIWSTVMSVNLESDNKDNLNSLAKQLIVLIENKTIHVPAHLHAFCQHKMKAWVRSAYQARLMDVDDQFILDIKNGEQSDVRHIFPIDKKTGTEQYNMKWSNGLSQFLELKYRLPFSTESLKAVFVSNKKFFKKYQERLYGLTGTLGSVSSCKLLETVYTIRTVQLPTNRAKRYSQTRYHVVSNEQEWYEHIQAEIASKTAHQPILIICENIRQLQLLKNYLLTNRAVEKQKIIDYARDGDDLEKKFKDEGAKPGQVILATNKGGRGTDIIIKEVDVPKGLHVILSFLPENTRIEEQAFGRAARAGQAGSGCLILPIDPKVYEDEIKMFGSLEAATEVFVEMENVKRDQAETDRLSVLLSDGLPKLDFEENLYSLFQECRKAFSQALNADGAEVLNVPVNSFEECKKACIGIMADHWAYWLESMRTPIQEADAQEKRDRIQDLFTEEFSSQGTPIPSSKSDCAFFKLPEDYTQLGHAFFMETITEKNISNTNIQKLYGAALFCFESAMEKGDKTGFPAMAACFCFIEINPQPSACNKKRVCHYLKHAQMCLNELRRGWMSNSEIGRLLSDFVDVSQYVDNSENQYLKQTEDKIEVIGLHLNIIETLLGSTLKESSFIKESTSTDEKITEEQSLKIYHKLVEHGLIYHHHVRKAWKKGDKLEKFLNQNVDPYISSALLNLILNNNRVTEDDISKIVHSSEELWEIFNPLIETIEEVVVIETKQVDTKLTGDSLQQSWQSFSEQFESQTTDFQLVLSAHDPVWKDKKYRNLVSYLNNKSLLTSTQRALLTETARESMRTLDLGAYQNVEILRENRKISFRTYIVKEVFEYCWEAKSGYLYENMFPYGKKSQEAKKFHVFLQQHEILKSGQLALQNKYELESSQLESIVKSALDKIYSSEQISHVLSIVPRLQGEVHKFTREMKVSFVEFHNLDPRHDKAPQTLTFFSVWHMDSFLTIKQVPAKRKWFDWKAFACAMIGVAQVIAGAALVAFTAGICSQIGLGLITEGINDMVYATIAGLTGTFSWKDWAIQKVVSLSISLLTGGIGMLSSGGAAKLGSPSFLGVLAKAAGTFATSAVAKVISDVLLAEVQQYVVTATMDLIKNNLFSGLKSELRKHLTTMYYACSTDNDFKKKCKSIGKHLTEALQKVQSSYIDQILSEIGGCLSKGFLALVDNLSKSSSKWAKIAGNTAKAIQIGEAILSLVNTAFKAYHLGSAVYELFKNAQTTAAEQGFTIITPSTMKYQTTKVTVEQHYTEYVGSTGNTYFKETGSSTAVKVEYTEQRMGETLISQELDCIEETYILPIQQKIESSLKDKVSKVVRQGVKQVGRASKKAVTECVKKAFNDRSPASVMNDLAKRTKVGTIVDHDNAIAEGQSHSQQPIIEMDERLKTHEKQREEYKDYVCDPFNTPDLTMEAPNYSPGGGEPDGGGPGGRGPGGGGPGGRGPGGRGPGGGGPDDRRNKVKRDKKKSPNDVLEYNEEWNRNGLTIEYKTRNGVESKSTNVFVDGRKVSHTGDLTGLEYTKERSKTGPISGTINRYIPRLENETKSAHARRKAADSMQVFHTGPANAGVNAGGRFPRPHEKGMKGWYDNAEPSSPHYNKKEWHERQRLGLNKIEGKFDVNYKMKLAPVDISRPEDYIQKIKDNTGFQVDSSNAKALQERMDLFKQKDSNVHRIITYSAEYSQVKNGKRVILGRVKLGEDVMLGVPQRFKNPNEPAQLTFRNAKREISDGKRKVKESMAPKPRATHTRSGRQVQPPRHN